jgi:hypothetical protein
MKKERYECKENDNHIICVTEENTAEDETEFWVGDISEDSWVIIGISDLRESLKQFNIKL